MSALIRHLRNCDRRDKAKRLNPEKAKYRSKVAIESLKGNHFLQPNQRRGLQVCYRRKYSLDYDRQHRKAAHRDETLKGDHWVYFYTPYVRFISLINH